MNLRLKKRMFSWKIITANDINNIDKEKATAYNHKEANIFGAG